MPPSLVMIAAVSPAAAALRSTQKTSAPSRAKVTAVALPLPQPGPIEPAPTTIATLPFSRSIDCSPFCCSFSLDEAIAKSGLRIVACPHPHSISTERIGMQELSAHRRVEARIHRARYRLQPSTTPVARALDALNFFLADVRD